MPIHFVDLHQALSIRRRPAPECWDNVWAPSLSWCAGFADLASGYFKAKTRITVDDHVQARATL